MNYSAFAQEATTISQDDGRTARFAANFYPGHTPALVVVQNNGQTPIHNACLTFFSNGPVEAAFSASTAVIADDPANSLESCEGIAMPPLPEGGAFSTLVNVKLTKHPVTGAALYFRAKYRFGKPPGGDPATAVGTLDVRGPAMPSADAIKVEAKVGFASLHENEAGRVVLTITNGTNDTLTLSKAIASKLPNADVTGPGDSGVASNAAADNGQPKLEAPSAISPQSAVAIDYTITAKPRILPGKYIGLIDVDAQTSCGVSLHRVAAYEVTLGVFGQSELLTTIGVPSLLFLPGFLVLTL